ncbi:hypothetical protein Trydic_g17525, partial [Trypoxylus dichotomus]
RKLLKTGLCGERGFRKDCGEDTTLEMKGEGDQSGKGSEQPPRIS